MTGPAPKQQWWTVDEIAAAGLPDLPGTRRGINLLAERLGWRGNPAFARRRRGKGGGWEYSWRLFPTTAQRKLLQAVVAPVQIERPDRDEVWSWYEALPADVRARAEARLLTIQQVEALEPVAGKFLAVDQVARLQGIGARTVWSWFALIEGVRSADRLPYLAPRHRATQGKARAKGRVRDCDPEFFELIKSDFLRLEAPSFSDCYRRACRIAAAKALEVLPERTMRRRLNRAVSRATQVLARRGIDAVKRLYPTQVRDKTALVAMEAVNADFHKFDVFVRWPGPRGEAPQIIRPQMVAFQDIHSGRILSWRIDVSANSTAVLLAAGDMIADWGIPEHVVLDNGREFAAKAVTGGASTRYRFKVKDDDIPGLFTALGCEIHWAQPYSGQSKPIERAFRDMCGSIAKDPRFAGAWTGNRPDAKPENYGSKAIDLEKFLAVVAEGIEEHNTRQGRRSEVAWGRSFAEVFDESYATQPIRKATEAQRRLWLLGAEGLRADSVNGRIRFQGNEFWADWMQAIAGARVVVRFDPAEFWSGLHVYAADGAYLGHAPCLVKAGFLDADEARAHARGRAAWLKAERKAADAQRRYKATEIGDMLDAIAPTDPVKPDAKVVRATFGKAGGGRTGGGKAAEPPRTDEPAIAAAQAGIVADLASRRSGHATEPQAEESPRERFRRALELERKAQGGAALTAEQQRWLSVYCTTPEYRAERMLWDERGDTIFG